MAASDPAQGFQGGGEPPVRFLDLRAALYAPQSEMPDHRRRTCRRCRQHESEVGAITWGGYCIDCGLAMERENVEQMVTRSGPQWAKWRRAMAACVGGVLAEDVRR